MLGSVPTVWTYSDFQIIYYCLYTVMFSYIVFMSHAQNKTTTHFA